jgi:two-component system phosphate regulon sensor histidine kinase PhoR
VIWLTGDTTINYRQFFHGLLEATPWPMLVVDRELSVSYYNQHAVRLLEVTGALNDTRLDQIVQDAAIIQLVQESIQTGSPRSNEYNKGSTGPAWKVSVIPLGHRYYKTKTGQSSKPAGQRYHYFVIAIEDLTELRRLERVRRDFITNISHELRTPLASVRLLAETLEDAIDTDREKAQTFVEKIEIEVQYLNDLVSELLELSRIESGQVAMTIEPVRAEQLVRETMARMFTLAQRHRVMLRTEIQQGGTMVAADSKQIARVLVNLVHNAIKFTPSGGMIVIGTAPEVEGLTQRFFVRDTGIGIRPEELPRIFERFYKADRARSKADFIGPGGGGSGLGLAIARHVVEAHGGRITAESTVGQGSTFTFTLPVAVQS